MDALFRLHRAHVERVAWETLWIHLDEWWPLDRAGSAARIADRGRGGYCFHLNGAFHELLVGLGYRVVGHAATVRHPGDGGVTTPDHLTLTVDDLPSDANPSGRWVVDVGLGSGLHEPIALLPGRTQQGRLRFDLDRRDDAGSRGCSWRLERTPPSGWAAITWGDTPTTLAAFDAHHRWLSRSPDSHFVQLLTVQRWHGGGHDVLRGLTLTAADSTTKTIGSRPELLATMRVDKKARGARLRFVVLDGLARSAMLEGSSDDLLYEAYQEVAAG